MLDSPEWDFKGLAEPSALTRKAEKRLDFLSYKF